MSPSHKDFKSRRAHEKSRSGCVRCKKQRKKACGSMILATVWEVTNHNGQCDELKPKCSRCSIGGYSCHYTYNRLDEDAKREDLLMVKKPEPACRCNSESSFSDTGSLASLTITPLPVLNFEEREETGSSLATFDILDSTELALLSHYLMHTSHIIPFDEDDCFVLQVGIPNLAFSCKPLMASLLALAAACKCHDIIKESPKSAQSLREIRDLLVFADQHHKKSLQQIRSTLPHTDRHDQVLANAVLMVLYGSANQSIRIFLTETWKSRGKVLPGDLLPVRSQWMSLIRAAHAAFVGLLEGIQDFANAASAGRNLLALERSPECIVPSLCRGISYSPEDGPSELSKRCLFPIIAATSSFALENLREKAQVIAMAEGLQGCRPGEATRLWRSSGSQQHPLAHDGPNFQACAASLDVLEDIVQKAVSAIESTSKCSEVSVGSEEQQQFNELAKIPPWLRTYVARVTSVTPPKAMRRIIMSFLNQVPFDFLVFIESTLALIPEDVTLADSALPETVNSYLPQPTMINRLAVNIFAHWLVMVMLLDSVWWIGGIGYWELGRVVWFMRAQGWLDFADAGERWWPEKMYKVRKALATY